MIGDAEEEGMRSLRRRQEAVSVMGDKVPHRLSVVEPTDRQLVDAVMLGKAMWEESPTYAHLAGDLDKMVEFAYGCRSDPETYCRVAVRDDTCHGFFVGNVAPYGFHDAMFAYDRLMYVRPDMRGSAAARMLIRDFEHWCKLRGVQDIRLGITTGVHTERTKKFYNALGYRDVGVLTMKGI